jgi:hypothetical protein
MRMRRATALGGSNGSRDRSAIGSHPVGRFGLVSTTLYLVALGVLAGYTLVSFWPGPDDKLHHYRFLWARLPITRENDLFLIVAMAGVVGATIYAMRSFFRYAGERKLKRGWLFQYYLTPFVGSGLGMIFYLVVRAGLLSSSASSTDTSAFGVAALAALGGMFIQPAIEKLKRIFEAVFTVAPKGSDDISAPSAASIDPDHGRPGDSVTISGSNLDVVTKVSFGGSVSTDVTPTDPATIQVTVPNDAATGPLTLTYAGGMVTSDFDWTLDG